MKFFHNVQVVFFNLWLYTESSDKLLLIYSVFSLTIFIFSALPQRCHDNTAACQNGDYPQ